MNRPIKNFKDTIVNHAIRCGFFSDKPDALNYYEDFKFLGTSALTVEMVEFRHIKHGGTIQFSVELLNGLTDHFKK